MSAQTIRTALGELQDDPDLESAWNDLQDAVTAPDPGLPSDELSSLLEAARQVHEGRREWEAVARLLELELALASGKPNEIAFLYELARVLEDELFDSVRALPTHRRIAQLRPGDDGVTDIIERIEAQRGRWREVNERYMSEVAETEEPAFRSSLLMSAAEIAWRFGRLEPGVADDVVKHLEESLRIDRTNLQAARLLEVVYRREGRWIELAKILDLIATEAGKEARLAAHLRLARLANKRLSDASRTVAAYEQALDLAPGNREAMEFLSQYFSDHEEWDFLVALYEDQLRAGAVAAGEELNVYLQIAMVHWRMRGKLDAAEPWFEKARKLAPAHGLAISFFREWCEQQNQKSRLVAVLTEAQRAMSDGPERAAIATELARLAEEDANAGKAIEQYKASLRADPNNIEAREALKRIYTQTEAWPALIDLLKHELERTPAEEKEARLLLLKEIVRLHKGHVKNDTSLLPFLTQIVQINDTDEETLRDLVRVYETLSRWRDLLTYQQKLADILEDQGEKASLYRSVARRWLDQFSNVGNGIDAYEALLKVEPQEEEARTKLRELYNKRRAWAPLFALSEREAEFAEGKAKVELLLEMAKLAAERLDRGADAIRLYREALRLEPETPGLLDLLEKQAEREKDFATVAEVLERRVDAASDESTRLNVLQKLGSVYADRLNDPVGAARAWRRVLDAKPDHTKALRVLRDAYLAAGDLDSLEELYAGQNDWDGLADVLSVAADKTSDPEQKVQFSLRSARVYEERLQQPERAFRAYERVLSVIPDDERSARALVPIYEREERWARLPALYEILLQHASSPEEKVTFLRRLAEISSQKINEKQAAVGYARKAYDLNPSGEQSLPFLEEIVALAGAWGELAEAIRWRLSQEGESLSVSERRQLQSRLAGIYSNHLEKVEDAVAIYRSLVEEDPSEEAIVTTLDQLLRSTGRKDDLRWLFELRAATIEGDARAQLFNEWAVLEEEVFSEPTRAIELYRRVLTLAPEDTTALSCLARLLLASGDAAGAAEIVARRRDLAAGPERAERELDLAELFAGPLQQNSEALAAAVRAIDLSPGDPRGIQMLERLLEISETRAQAARVLQKQYEQSEDALKESGALQVMLEVANDPSEQLALYQRLADVHEKKLGDAMTALAVLLRALREFPTELSLWDRAHVQADASSQFPALAAALSATLAGDPTLVDVELCERAAALHDEKLGDSQGAIPYLNRILARDPGNEAAFSRLKQILTNTERWPELEEIYERACSATPSPERQVELLAEMALVCEEITSDRPKAIRYHERILSLEPFHEPSLRALDTLYQQENRPSELSQLLARRLERASEEETISLKLRLGRLHLDALEQPEVALGHLDEVLRLAPSNQEARELLERILENPALRARTAEILERVYEEVDDPANLVRILEIRLESTTGDELRRDLLRRIAQLQDERLHDEVKTFSALLRLVPLDPANIDARSRLLDVAAPLGTEKHAATALLAASENALEQELKANILMEVARVYVQALQDLPLAEEVYRRVVGLDPQNPDLVLPAARALEGIYEASDNPKALAEILRLEVQLETAGEARLELWARLGELSESTLDDPSAAIQAWSSRLAEDPSNERSLAALERLYERTSAWSQLVDTLRAREQISSDQDERRRLLVKAAETLATRLEDTAGAIRTWETVRDTFGSDRSTLAALATLYEAASQWSDLAAILESGLELTEDTSSKLGLFCRLGDVRRQFLNDLPGALDAYRQALQLDPSHPPSRLALELLLEVEEARRDAANILHPLYESDGDFERLLRVLDIEIETAEDPGDRLLSLESAVRTAVGPLGDPNRAFSYACRALREAVADPSLESWFSRLEALASSTGKYTELVEVFASVSNEVLDEEIQRHTWLRIAEIARIQLSNQQLARDWYRKVLELRPDDRTALTALESLYEEMKDTPALLEILRRRAESAESTEEKRSLLYRQANLTREIAQDRNEAILVYEAILDLGLDTPAILALEVLYAEESRFNDLVALYERELVENAGEPAELYVKLATVAERNLHDIPLAFEKLDAALEIDPQHTGAISALERLLSQAEEPSDRARAGEMLEPVYKSRADWKSLLKSLEAQLSASQDVENRRSLLRQLATLHEEQQEDYRAALETTAQLLHEDLSDEETWSELERLAKVADAEERLAQIFANELDGISVDEPATARLARRTGEIFAQLGNIDQALRFYRRALAFEPESRDLFQAIDSLLINAKRPAERVDLYRSALDHRFDVTERVSILHTIADLEENALQEPDKAIDTYRAVIDADERDTRALDALTRLYRSRQRWRDLAELYQRRAENESDNELAANHRLALARLYRNELDEVASAIDQLETIVSDMPWHREAIVELERLTSVEEHKARVVEILTPLYARADDWQNLIRLTEQRLGLAEDPSERIAIYREAAQLYEERADDRSKAFDSLAQAFLLDPEDASLRADLERLAQHLHAWDRLASTYERTIVEAEKHVQRELLLALAKVHDEKRDDPRQALDAYRRLRDLDDADLEPLEAMDPLSLMLADWSTHVAVLSRKAELVLGDEDRAQLFCRIGGVRRDMIEDNEGAIVAFEKAFEFEPNSVSTIDALIELHEQKANAPRLVELYRCRVDLSNDQEENLKYDLLSRMARCYEEPLQQRHDAIEALRETLVIRPNDKVALQWLDRLFRQEELWPDLLENLRLQAAIAESPQERIELRRTMGDLHRLRLDDPLEALECYRMVLDDAPGDDATIQAVRQIGEAQQDMRTQAADILDPVLRSNGRWNDLVAVLEMRLQAISDETSRTQTLRTMAIVQELNLNDPAAAEKSLLRALSDSPEDEDIHAEIERLAASAGWERYADTLSERATASSDPTIAQNLHTRLGKIAEEHLKEDSRAIQAYRAALEQAGDEPSLLEALDRLYSRSKDSRSLSEILERRVGVENDPNARADFLWRLALLQINDFKEPSTGLSTLHATLEARQDHPGAREALEALTTEESLFEEVSEMLEQVYLTLGDHAHLAKLLEKRITHTQSSSDRIRLRLDLARVFEEKLGDAKHAQSILEAALLDDPSDMDVLSELERLMPITNDWSSGAAALEKAIPEAPSLTAETARDLYVRLAEWYRDRVSNKQAAENAYDQALAKDPEAIDIVRALEDLRRVPGRERELVDTLRKRAKLETDLEQKKSLLKEAKTLADGLSDDALAEAVLRQLLEEYDGDLWALAQLTSLREKAADWREATDLLLKRAGLEADGNEIARLHHHAAELLREKLHDKNGAIQLYEELFENDPNDAKASSALRVLYDETNKTSELSRLLERLIDIATSSSERTTLRMEQARLLSEKLLNIRDAIDVLRAVLDEEPGQPAAVVELSQLYEKSGKDDELAEFLHSQIELAQERNDQSAELAFKVRLGEIYENRLRDVAKAVQTYEAVLEKDPNHKGALSASARLLLAKKELPKAVQALTRLLDLETGKESVVIALQLAEAQGNLKNDEGARSALERALAVEPKNLEVRSKLRSLYERNQNWEQLANLIATDAEDTEKTEEKLALLRKAADIHSTKRNNPSAAAVLLEKASALQPEDRDLLLALCEVYSLSGRGKDAIQALERIKDSYGGKRSKELAAVHQRLAQAYLSENDKEKALTELDAAFKIDPGSIATLRDLGILTLEMGDLDRAQKTFRALLLQRLDANSPISKAEVFYYLGETSHRQNDKVKAIQMLERALENDSAMEKAKMLLAQLKG